VLPLVDRRGRARTRADRCFTLNVATGTSRNFSGIAKRTSNDVQTAGFKASSLA
jgi:hypothetical protein